MPYKNNQLGAIVYFFSIDMNILYIMLHMRLNYILLPVLCYVKWQLFQSCVFCCNILPSSFQREIKKRFLLRRRVFFFSKVELTVPSFS